MQKMEILQNHIEKIKLKMVQAGGNIVESNLSGEEDAE